MRVFIEWRAYFGLDYMDRRTLHAALYLRIFWVHFVYKRSQEPATAGCMWYHANDNPSMIWARCLFDPLQGYDTGMLSAVCCNGILICMSNNQSCCGCSSWCMQFLLCIWLHFESLLSSTFTSQFYHADFVASAPYDSLVPEAIPTTTSDRGRTELLQVLRMTRHMRGLVTTASYPQVW